MESNFSLADVAAVTEGNRENGVFGSNGGMWIFALLILLLIGGGGFFGRNNTQGITEADLCNSESFNDLKSGVRNVSDQISNMNIGFTKGLCDFGYTTAQQFNTLQSQVSSGTSETKSAIDNVRYDMANFSAAIQANDTANTQKILDALCADKVATLQNQVNQLQLQTAMCGVVRYPNSTTYAVPFAYGCNSATI